MSWTAPRVEEIAMSAEIGAYQNDLDREEDRRGGGEPAEHGETAERGAVAERGEAE